MLYNIVINQKAIIDNELNVTANHIAVLEVVVTFILSNNAQTLRDKLGDWYWVSYELIIDQIPMFEIKRDRCRQIVKELCNEALLEANPNNQSLGRVYLRAGKKYSTYKNFTNPLLKNSQPPCEKISNPLAKKLATPCEKISNDNNINNNTIKDNIIKENKITADFQKSDFDLGEPQNEKEKSCVKKEKDEQAIEVLAYLNKLAEKRYTPTKTNLNFITARLSENNSVEDLKRVIEVKCHDWKADHKMNQYLRPETLFNATKFQTYIQKVEKIIQDPQTYLKNERDSKTGAANSNRPDSAENIASMFSSIDNAFGGK